MARRKYEFQPDRPQTSILEKLYLTQKQRGNLLRWFLHALVVLILSLVQDVILCRMNIFGATTDLVPGAIFTLCMLLGCERGCVFTLVAAALFECSGMGPGFHAIALIPVIGIGLSMLQQTLLRKSVSSDLLFLSVAIMAYEIVIFAIGVATGETALFRIISAVAAGGMTVICSFILYPIFTAIEKIGGTAWNA